MDNLKNCLIATALAGILCLGSAQTSFAQNLVVNGNFTTFTTAPTNVNGAGLNKSGYTTGATLTGWSNSGYNFVFSGGNIGDSTITGSGGSFSLWGPKTGSTNGLSGAPNGGNVVAADGAYQVGPLTQVIVGLTSGKDYAVSFKWAAGQQSTFTGDTTESWSVALGGATGVFSANSDATAGTLVGGKTTTPVTNPSHSFTGWMSQTFTFTATSASETLYFLANGTPTGEPPFSLLSNVSMIQVPEASTYWTILFGSLIMIGTWASRQQRKRVLAKA